MANRRAIVLHLDRATTERVDAIRRRWDPVMAARIGPHITLVHDVVGDGAIDARVAEVADGTAPFVVGLAAATLWGPARYGIFLGLDDPAGTVAGLHGALADLEAPGWARVEYRPHVTLVHGRTVTADDADAAWDALGGLHAGWPAEITAIDVVELVEPRWRPLASFPLGG